MAELIQGLLTMIVVLSGVVGGGSLGYCALKDPSEEPYPEIPRAVWRSARNVGVSCVVLLVAASSILMYGYGANWW